MLELVLTAALCVAALTYVWFSRRDKARDGEWHPHGVTMRRWIDGKWQTRPMTDAEILASAEKNSW